MVTLFVATDKNRMYLLENVLNTEIFRVAQTLASDQYSLYHGTESSVKTGLIQTIGVRKIQPDSSGCMIELSMLLQNKQPL